MVKHTIYLSDSDPKSIKLAELLLIAKDTLKEHNVIITVVKKSERDSNVMLPSLYIDGTPRRTGYMEIANYYTNVAVTLDIFDYYSNTIKQTKPEKKPLAPPQQPPTQLKQQQMVQQPPQSTATTHPPLSDPQTEGDHALDDVLKSKLIKRRRPAM